MIKELSKRLKIRYILTITVFLLFFFGNMTVSLPDKGVSRSENQMFQEADFLTSNVDDIFLSPENLKAFNKVFPDFMEKWHIKGASVAVVKNGDLVFTKGYGYADAEQKQEVETNHMFRIASVSKLITAVAVMKLVEQGKLSLDDRVFGEEGLLNDSAYLNYRDWRVKLITVRHLLNHTGGWSNWRGDPMFLSRIISNTMDCDNVPNLETIISYVLSKRKLDFKPGTRSFYSNFGYAVLGKIVALSSESTYEEYVQANIFKPLGIRNIKPGRNFLSGRYPNEVKYYTHDGGKCPSYFDRNVRVPRQYGGNDIETLGGAGEWIASAPALMKLLVAIDGYDNKPDILSKESIELMTQSTQKMDPFGWRGTNKKGYWWRTGSFSGTSAIMVRQPDSTSWVVLSNTSTWKGDKFTPIVYQKIEGIIKNIDSWPEHDLFIYNHPYFLMADHMNYNKRLALN